MLSTGIWGPAFCPCVQRRVWEATGRKKGKFQWILFAKGSNTNRTNFEFPFLRPVNIQRPPGGGFLGWFCAVLGGSKLGPYSWKNRVGFGRTELSLRLSWTEFCALSSGHGPRGEGFYGGSSRVDFHVFQGGQKSAKKIVYTSQKKSSPDHRKMIFRWF